MQKFQQLLLDANVIIELHKFQIWDEFIRQCKVTLTETVANDEAHFWLDQTAERHDFDLLEDISNNRISCVKVSHEQIGDFYRKFDQTYAIHAGEAEALALLSSSEEMWLISSSDGMVFRVLGRTGRADRGISLEEILCQIGLGGKKLDRQYTRTFRDKFTRMGEQDAIRGRGTIP